ncbi:MAG: Hsp20/alpha crystallin family protein [Erysipelotrichaceae bacterium]
MKFLPGLRAFDNVFDDIFYEPFLATNNSGSMKTDIKEKDGNYLFDMELPGYKKEDIKIDLKDGYLNVSATRNVETDEKDKEGNVIRQERYSGSCSRSFFVGEQTQQEDIKANFENGELKITLPKQSTKKEEEKKFIPID